MTRIRTTFRWAVPVAFCLIISIVALAIQRYASPPGGLQLPPIKEGDGDLTIHTGSFAYPREAIDRDGFRVRIPGPARRIVSQYYSIDEFVYSVVPPETVVAVSEGAYEKSYSNAYPFAEQFRPVVATDAETVLRLEPDLILVSDNNRWDYTSLMRSAGVPVYRMQTLFRTLHQVREAILLVGYLTGADAAAHQEADRFQADIEKAHEMAEKARADGIPSPRILGLGGNYSYGRETLFQDIVSKLDGVNVGAEAGLTGYDSINSEQIIRWDPDWIVAGADPGKVQMVLHQLLADPAISITKAGRNGHVLVLENHIFLPLSPYTTLLVDAMAMALYGSK
jgi:iron complex transport system substrate-binding protein